MNIRDNIQQHFDELEEEVPILDPEILDTAIIGVTDNNVVYSYEKLVEAYTREFKDDSEDETDAHEQAIGWIGYNTMRSLPYMGDNKPIIIYENF